MPTDGPTPRLPSGPLLSVGRVPSGPLLEAGRLASGQPLEAGRSRLQQRKAATRVRHRVQILQTLADKTDGETARYFRDTLNLNTVQARIALRSLLADGLIVQTWITKRDRDETGYRLARRPTGIGPNRCLEHEGTVIPGEAGNDFLPEGMRVDATAQS
jgi:hypothetical protein